MRKALIGAVAVVAACVLAAVGRAGGSTFTFFTYQADTTLHTQSFQTWYGGGNSPGNAHIVNVCGGVQTADVTITGWQPVGGGWDAITQISTSGHSGEPCTAQLLRGGGSKPLGTATYTAP